MTRRPCTVGIYCRQDVVREGLICLLSRHPDEVCIVPIPTMPDHADPDVVLYDVVALLDGDTRALTYLVERTTSKVLAVGRDLRPDLVCTALGTGVDGFFDLGVTEKELLTAVFSASTGWEVGDPGRDPIVGSSASDERANRLGSDVGLTAHEIEILSLIAQGVSNQEIASRVYLSINSVKTYIRTAYRKIDAHNRAEAVGWAIRHGFASDDTKAADHLGRHPVTR
jgi:DNA-binding NarL/FixJ family response regulator